MRDEIIEILAMINPSLDFDSDELEVAENLDSEEMNSLVEELENKYGIEITEEERTKENFENIDTLVEMIEHLQ